MEPLKKDRVLSGISRALGTSPWNTVFVGDSIWDLPALTASGSPVFLSHSREEASFIDRRASSGEDSKRILVARSSSELLEILGEILLRPPPPG